MKNFKNSKKIQKHSSLFLERIQHTNKHEMQDVTDRFLNRSKIKPTKFVFTPKGSGKKRRVKKPGWDDSVSDLSRYKLSKEEMQRRKMSFLSPHNVLTSKSKKKKKSLTTKDVQDKLKALKSRRQRGKKKEPLTTKKII